MPPARPALLALLAALAGACVEEDLDPAWKVRTFRVLAVVADPPDAVPGETVQLTAVYADLPGATRTVAMAWQVCTHAMIDPVTGLRACAPGDGELLAGTRVAFTAPPLDPPTGSPAAASDAYAIFGYACAGGVLGRAAAGDPTCAGGDGFAVLRAVPVRRPPANHNPRIARVLLDGAEVAPDATATVRACAATPRSGCPTHPVVVEFAADAREPYPVVQADGSTVVEPEDLISEFLTDRGDLDGAFRSDGDPDATPAHRDNYTAPATPGAARIWLVVRDGRGGFDATVRTLAVTP